jgi:hypothetical protein
MKQSDFNVILGDAAKMIAALPPAYNNPWWGSANLSFREHMALENMMMFEAIGKRHGCVFSRATFIRTALPDCPLDMRKILVSDDFDMFNGIWARKGTDPYESGLASAIAGANGSPFADIAAGTQLAAGIASARSAA